jgi:hypothetical protein
MRGSCVASSHLPVHGYQFINLDTKELDPGGVHGIFRGLALHNISGERLPTVGGKTDVRDAVVGLSLRARRRLAEARPYT